MGIHAMAWVLIMEEVPVQRLRIDSPSRCYRRMHDVQNVLKCILNVRRGPGAVDRITIGAVDL